MYSIFIVVLYAFSGCEDLTTTLSSTLNSRHTGSSIIPALLNVVTCALLGATTSSVFNFSLAIATNTMLPWGKHAGYGATLACFIALSEYMQRHGILRQLTTYSTRAYVGLIRQVRWNGVEFCFICLWGIYFREPRIVILFPVAIVIGKLCF
jgi:hypothetical protein